MLYYGEFLTQAGKTCRVEIVTNGDSSSALEIGAVGSGVLFSSDPVQTAFEGNDTFGHLLTHSASISLLTRGFLPDLFSSSPFGTEVSVSIGGECIFLGFLEPRTYSQPYAELYDTLELNCIDMVSALQYRPYRDCGAPGSGYQTLRENAGMRSFRAILEECLGHAFHGGVSPLVTWDNSLAIPGNSGNILDELTIHELLFLGDSEEDVWTCRDVVEEIMRYLGLHLRQEGKRIRIFSLDNLMRGTLQNWYPLSGTGTWHEGWGRKTVTITAANASGTDHRLSIGDTFNRISLTAEVKEMESVVESPLDEESMTDPFTGKQLYQSSYGVNAGGSAAIHLRKMMTEGGALPSEDCERTDWYIRMKDSLQWRFLLPDATGATETRDLYGENHHQERALNLLATGAGSALMAYGSVEYPKPGDNSLTATIPMTNALVVAVNGNGKDAEGEAYPTEAQLKGAVPVAEYTGNTSGGAFSPPDDTITNYIVISGNIELIPRLQPNESPGCYMRKTEDISWNALALGVMSGEVVINDGKPYLRATKWWQAETPSSSPQPSDLAYGFWLPPASAKEEYQFNYSAVGDSTDTVSKVGVLECMLVIGDKCLVETGTEGKPSDFSWKPFKKREACSSDDEYYAQSFSIGFDPKIGDFLVGTEFPVQNNISFEMGLDMEGMAIPIRKSDKLTGKVSFSILGPVNLTWGTYTRRHRTFFRREKWSSNTVPLMAHVSAIRIKDFQMDITSDNGRLDSDEGELVYTSDTDERFVNVKDDLSTRITTELSLEERMELGASGAVKMSAPVVASSGDALLKLTSLVTGDTAKPEQLYVDARWREWHEPRVILEHSLRESSGDASLSNIYLHPAMPGKRFCALGIGRNVIGNRCDLTLKECNG